MSVGFVVAGTSTASANEEWSQVLEADVSDISGLQQAHIEFDVTPDETRVVHHYEYDMSSFGASEQPTGATLELQTSNGSELVETHSDGLDAGTLEAVATEQTRHSPSDEVSSELETHQSTSMTPFADTTSPLCGDLATTDVPVEVDHFGGRFEGADIETWADDDVDCPDPIHPIYETSWEENSDDLDWDSDAVEAEAEYETDEFPVGGTVSATHTFDLGSTTSSQWEIDIETEASGYVPSDILLELRSDAGTDR
ncbi:hypothetical protein B1756_18855 [Natrarchaeobaculum aegyptiacum]|uniref:Uncharacterized protein n=1 Tax=Natrarchaeobaculum aegyptiacum TaxID=745377 RepID=A0A2Z2HW79_9EURY|nr:hypothetical protein B1756_18855 [Natrarchaeobaculum aegyptiacum]